MDIFLSIHRFGGLYPNPSVAGAALAAITERVDIRAGSCVLPLHDPIRVAEEWSLVDNLSNGRVGISFAFTITNIKTWLIDNEEAENGVLVDVQRVVLKFVRTHTFAEIQEHDEEALTKLAQKELGRYFGVQVKQLGITTFVETVCRDLNHSGISMPGTNEEDDE